MELPVFYGDIDLSILGNTAATFAALFRSLYSSTVVDNHCVERFVELPVFCGNIDQSILGATAATLAAKSALATLEPVDFGSWLASYLVFFGFISSIQVLQIWKLLDFGFELIIPIGFDFVK